MESRLERYKRRKIERKIKRRRRIVVVLVLLTFILAMECVNQSFRASLCQYDKRIIAYNMDNHIYNIELFGKDYSVSQQQVYLKIQQLKNKIEDIIYNIDI
ncbi:hypothetical protein [Caldisalinibacter kiritimatiensis]|uniref:Uncharacterized protein n=1 Tax=Caldisalinibacter kiritimatiensis TaxID=1304284 RepID=R1CUM3_9FIRM|nr:hypothetical protein [Caldisalinibacter kiritimatiensis]EOD00369.1 hypothetical protein L21TH_1587 [Caldisalinibacter kiritimatiensis]